MKKSTVIILFVMLLSFATKAQGDWQQIYNENGIVISTKEETCKNKMGHMQRTFLMKVENTNAQLRSVEWDLQKTDTNGKCIGCNSSNTEAHRKIRIKANSTLEAKCSDQPGNNPLMVVMNFEDLQLKNPIREVKIINITSANLK